MTDNPNFDLEALLGPDADPDRRAQLAALLSEALAGNHEGPAPDIAELAAYLDQDLTESERLSFHQNLSKSAIGRADLESAAELLVTVQNSAERPSPAIMRQAANVMMAAAAQARQEQGYGMVAAAGGGRVHAAAALPQSQKTFWQRFLKPRAKIGLGLAFASLVAVLVWNAQRGMDGSSPLASNGPDRDVSQQAVAGATPKHSIPSPAQPQTWGAIALSSDGKAYGISNGAATQELAGAFATTDCIAHHGLNCRIAVAGQGQCFALAAPPDGVSVAAAAENASEAQNRAMAACRSAQNSTASCSVAKTFCSGS